MMYITKARKSLFINGAPTRTRTWDLLLRRQLLYPTELLAREERIKKALSEPASAFFFLLRD